MGLAPAEAITSVLQQVDGAPGGVTNWLTQRRVPIELINAWRGKLVDSSAT